LDNLELNFNEIINMIETRRKNAYKKVNEELISLYWDFGKYISEKVNDSNWGDKIVDKLVEFMKREYPTMKGFTRPGIYRMKQFYETYKDNEIVSTLLRQISWSNNVKILSGTNSMEEKEFYIRMCIKNNYSARELDRQLSSGYFHRYMLSDGKANQSLSKATGEEDYPNTKLLDTYSLEFLDLPNNYSEKDLKKTIISNMKDFILEIGKDFTFVGEEYRVQVGNEDFYIDLLFYHRKLKRLVVVELKLDKFRPEYKGQVELYLKWLDKYEKAEGEEAPAAIILCATKSDMMTELLELDNSGIHVAQYLTNYVPKELLQEKFLSSIKNAKIQMEQRNKK